MEAQSLGSHQHSWWFSCFSLREKLARSHNKNVSKIDVPILGVFFIKRRGEQWINMFSFLKCKNNR